MAEDIKQIIMKHLHNNKLGDTIDIQIPMIVSALAGVVDGLNTVHPQASQILIVLLEDLDADPKKVTANQETDNDSFEEDSFGFPQTKPKYLH